MAKRVSKQRREEEERLQGLRTEHQSQTEQTLSRLREFGVIARLLDEPPSELNYGTYPVGWIEVLSGPIRWVQVIRGSSPRYWVPDANIDSGGPHVQVKIELGRTRCDADRELDGFVGMEFNYFEDALDIPVDLVFGAKVATSLSNDPAIRRVVAQHGSTVENHLIARCWVIKTGYDVNRQNWQFLGALAGALLKTPSFSGT